MFDIDPMFCFRFEADLAQSETGNLLQKLVEVELDAQAAVSQVTSLRDTVHQLREVGNRINPPHPNSH